MQSSAAAHGYGFSVAGRERVRGLPVHDKDIAISDHAASLPDWKRTASSVVLVRLPHIDAIDSDR
jgi:hypothetical protein